MIPGEAMRLKARWAEMPAEFFETLTFGDLEVGQQFIVLPQPGDNSGHGGLKGAQRVFTKTRDCVREVLAGGGLIHPIDGGAVDNQGNSSDFPDFMLVIPLI